jgi:hypothetical protein
MTKYVLMLENGKYDVFSVKSCAEIYQQIRGGKIVEIYIGDK